MIRMEENNMILFFLSGMYLSFKYKINLFMFAYTNRTSLARVHSSHSSPKWVFCLQFSMIPT